MGEFLHHIAIVVSDVDEASRFYREVFGFSAKPRLTESLSKNPGAWFQVGSFELHLQGRASSRERTEQHFALVVSADKFSAVCERAPGLGGRVEKARLLEGFSRRCFVYDPDQNRIELLAK